MFAGVLRLLWGSNWRPFVWKPRAHPTELAGTRQPAIFKHVLAENELDHSQCVGAQLNIICMISRVFACFVRTLKM